jgi:hypothetical protein
MGERVCLETLGGVERKEEQKPSAIRKLAIRDPDTGCHWFTMPATHWGKPSMNVFTALLMVLMNCTRSLRGDLVPFFHERQGCGYEECMTYNARG